MTMKKTKAEIFESLLKPHIAGMYKAAFRLTGKKETAEDLVQEVLVKLYPKTSEMQKIDKLGPWLRKIIYRQFIDEIRKRTRRPEGYLAGATFIIDNMNSSENNPEKMATITEIREKLQAALNALDERYRAVIMMHFVEGYTIPEMAKILNVSPETLKTQLRRGKARLKKYLKI